MRKLNLIAASIALAGFSAAATAAPAPDFYLGGQVGYQHSETELSVDRVGSIDESISGGAGSIFAGVQFQLGHGYFLAPEVNLGSSMADGELVANNAAKVELESGFSLGAGVLLGKHLSPNTSIYSRLGYQQTEYELTATDNMGNSASAEEDFGGVRYGLGVETAFTPALDVRLDWSQTQYSDEGGQGLSVEPTENLFQVGLTYTF